MMKYMKIDMFDYNLIKPITIIINGIHSKHLS